jgi:hypothetical protein
VGLKDEFQGTGVWSFIKAKREKKDEKKVEGEGEECKPCKELEDKASRDPPKTRPDYHRKP